MNNDDETAASKRMHVGTYQEDFFESAVVVGEGDIQGAALCAEGMKCYLLVLSKLHSLCTGIKLQSADGKGFLQQCAALLELMTALLPSLASPQGIIRTF